VMWIRKTVDINGFRTSLHAESVTRKNGNVSLLQKKMAPELLRPEFFRAIDRY